MAGMIDQLTDVLNEQSGRYNDLLGLSREKRGVIISNDIEALQKITHLENIIVSQNQKLEKKRQAIVKDIALVMNRKESELTLSELIKMMDGQEGQARLSETGRRIQSTLTQLSAENEHNASLIDNALDYIEYSLNIIRSTMEQDPGFYTPVEPARKSAGLFDAKK